MSGRKDAMEILDQMCGEIWTDATNHGTCYCMIKGRHSKHICEKCRKPKK